MRRLALVAAFFCATSALAAGPATTNNDGSCDIALQPAATTLFTIQNVSRYPQIAHVVLWTDWSFPALDFNVFFTGYDVQGINLYDVFARGDFPPRARSRLFRSSCRRSPHPATSAGGSIST